MSRPRALVVAVGGLALLLALAPFVPRGGDDDGALQPSGDRTGASQRVVSSNAAGRSAVTPAMRAEIDRVVAAGRSVGRVGTKAGLAREAQLVRCAELDGQRYCLGIGWTEDTEADVRARVTAAARVAARATGRTTTGDLDASAALARTARLSSKARAAADRAELEAAAQSVAKVWLLRHEIQGEPLPADFLDRHPEARAVARAGTKPTATAPPPPPPRPPPPRRPPRPHPTWSRLPRRPRSRPLRRRRCRRPRRRPS
jgi:hypothetical protein